MTLRLAALVLPALALACARHPPTAMPDDKGPRNYKVGVATGNGDALATSITTLRVVPRGGAVFAFMTEHAEGTWEEGAAAMVYDSATPKGTDPWPITLQHAVASVPAPIRIGPAGQLQTFEQQDAWKNAAKAAIAAADLPDQATLSAQTLLDPDGVLRDLRRNFPGTPAVDQAWVREETVAGLPARRVETCSAQADGAMTTWSCEGTLEGPKEGTARLMDGISSTVLTVDKSGLRDLDLTYEGTLVFLAPDGREVLHRPIYGRRRVVRQEP